MDETSILVLQVLVLLGGLGLCGLVIKRSRRSTTKTDESVFTPLTEGRVKITGKVGEKTILSPISRTPCVAYRIKVEKKLESKAKPSRGQPIPWMENNTKDSRDPFELITMKDTFLVYASGGKWNLSLNCEVKSLDADQKSALHALGIEMDDFFTNLKMVRVKEYVIRPQQDIEVTGNLKLIGGKKTISSVGDGYLAIDELSSQAVKNEK